MRVTRRIETMSNAISLLHNRYIWYIFLRSETWFRDLLRLTQGLTHKNNPENISLNVWLTLLFPSYQVLCVYADKCGDSWKFLMLGLGLKLLYD